MKSLNDFWYRIEKYHDTWAEEYTEPQIVVIVLEALADFAEPLKTAPTEEKSGE